MLEPEVFRLSPSEAQVRAERISSVIDGMQADRLKPRKASRLDLVPRDIRLISDDRWREEHKALLRSEAQRLAAEQRHGWLRRVVLALAHIW